VLRANVSGAYVRIKDVARVELGAQTYAQNSRVNGKPAAVLGLYQLPGTNAIKAVEGVRKLMEELKQRFPAGLEYDVARHL
jgi:hydrophobic/amphiphilic exporter-1 (mainly G- bacteria), HAE1 family